MRKMFLLLPVLALVGACVSYEKERVVEPQGGTSSTVVVHEPTPRSTTVVVPQSSPSPAPDTTIVVPR